MFRGSTGIAIEENAENMLSRALARTLPCAKTRVTSAKTTSASTRRRTVCEAGGCFCGVLLPSREVELEPSGFSDPETEGVAKTTVGRRRRARAPFALVDESRCPRAYPPTRASRLETRAAPPTQTRGTVVARTVWGRFVRFVLAGRWFWPRQATGMAATAIIRVGESRNHATSGLRVCHARAEVAMRPRAETRARYPVLSWTRKKGK